MQDTSTNLSKLQREHLLDICSKIKKQEPVKVTEIAELEQFIKSMKYGLSFEKHEEPVDRMLKTHIPVFKEFKEVINNPESADCNFLLEGDNLHSLKLLEKTHKGRIDVCYIDPPYNTLNEDFIYGDKMLDENDGFVHSKWLSFMKERLEIARKLLADDGVIFISIDDREQAQLKLLCDEIFGSDNFYGEFIQQKGNTQNDSKMIQRNHEYIICYVKNNSGLFLTYENETKQPVFEDQYTLGRDTGASSGHDKLIERANLGYTIYYIESTINGATGNHNKLIERANRLNQKYGEFNYIISSNGSTFKHAIAVSDYDKTKITENAKETDVYTDCQDLIEAGYSIIRPPKRKGNKLGRWTWELSTFAKYWNDNEVLIKNNKNIIKKVFIPEKEIYEDKKTHKKYYKKVTKLPLQSIINIGNSSGTTKLKGNNGVLPGCTFNNPKSVELLKFLIGAYYKPNASVLDFFAGSGTTGHAIMELNQEDGGNRHFILCTNNEVSTSKQVDYIHSKGYMKDVKTCGKSTQSKINKFFEDNPDVYKKLIVEGKNDYETYGICQSVTFPRLNTVITGIRPDGKKYSDGIKANLRYFQTDMIAKNDEDLDELLYEASFCLAELDCMSRIDNKTIRVAECDEDVDDIIQNATDDLKTVFVAYDVFFDTEQQDFFDRHHIETKRIPDCYYIEY